MHAWKDGYPTLYINILICCCCRRGRRRRCGALQSLSPLSGHSWPLCPFHSSEPHFVSTWMHLKISANQMKCCALIALMCVCVRVCVQLALRCVLNWSLIGAFWVFFCTFAACTDDLLLLFGLFVHIIIFASVARFRSFSAALTSTAYHKRAQTLVKRVPVHLYSVRVCVCVCVWPRIYWFYWIAIYLHVIYALINSGCTGRDLVYILNTFRPTACEFRNKKKPFNLALAIPSWMFGPANGW